jgi:hypothetical protein
VRSIKTSAYVGVDTELNPSSWNSPSSSVLFPLLIDYSIWNYSSNTIQTGRLR